MLWRRVGAIIASNCHTRIEGRSPRVATSAPPRMEQPDSHMSEENSGASPVTHRNVRFSNIDINLELGIGVKII